MISLKERIEGHEIDFLCIFGTNVKNVMKQIFSSCTLIIFATVFGYSQPTELQKPLDNYVLGLQKGRLELLQQAFLPHGSFCLRQSDNNVLCKPFSEVLPTWTTPDPKCKGSILSWEATEVMARITYGLDYNDTKFKDYLLLYKLKAGWIIISKTTEIIVD
jgi:Putative lumazine-binding